MDQAGSFVYRPAAIPSISRAAPLYSLPIHPITGIPHHNSNKKDGGGRNKKVRPQKRKPAAEKGVKVPRDKHENRALKEAANFEEDDNEDIAYLNFPLIWPLCAVSAFSLTFFLIAFATMEFMEHLSFERFALNQLLFTYGKTLGFCNNTFPYERGMWPSFVRQVELKVLSNVCFRVAVCVPMAVRIFVAFIIRNSARDNSLVLRNPILHWLNEMSAPVAIAETFGLALFSIVTIRFDYPQFYKSMFGLFILSSSLYQFSRTLLTFSADQMARPDLLAGIGRLVCCLIFTWTGSQLFQNHQRFIDHPGCHGYVSPGEAITEYMAILSYGVFSLLQLVDMRNIRFICYPRSCSGECEPLRPENFRVPGGKFEHCRAFEWAQRRNACGAQQRDPNGEQQIEQEEEEFPAKFSSYGAVMDKRF